MALDVRSGTRHLLLDRTPAGVTADGVPLDARTGALGGGAVLVVADGRPVVATVERDGKTARVTVGGHVVEVSLRTETDLLLERFGMDAADTGAEREVRAPMPGLVLRVLAAPGEAVEAGQGLVVLEAMKMENELKAPAAGTVAAVHAAPGAAVSKGDLLVELAP
jgi:pyruvate carboxylase subunit B